MAGSTTEWPRSRWQTASIRPGSRWIRARDQRSGGRIAHRQNIVTVDPFPRNPVQEQPRLYRSGSAAAFSTGVPMPPSSLTITHTIGDRHSPARLSDS